MPIDLGPKKLEVLLKALIKSDEDRDEDEDEDALDRPYLFFLGEDEIKTSIRELVKTLEINKERSLPITYKPQSIFK